MKLKESQLVRIQFETADGITMKDKVPYRLVYQREIYRQCMVILRIDGKDRACNQVGLTPKRKYVLWSKLKNGTYVFREDL